VPVWKNPLLDKLKANKIALGTGSNNPHEPELLAALGFDWFWIDQMFTDNGWEKTQVLLWAGEAAGITPVVRIQSHPWAGYDHRLCVDVSRAQGIGAQFILVSHSDDKEIEECLEVGHDWHRRALTVHPFTNPDWDAKIDAMSDSAFIIPHAETKGALEQIERTMELPGLKMFFIAMTDASRIITGQKKPDFENPKLWDYLRKVVEIAGKKGIYVGTNTSYSYTMAGMRERVKKLADAGIKFIMIQHTAFLLQIALTEFLEGVTKDLNL
jgi:2-keto-3-deoxy-L-rhamnonate aldolase RhmA